MGSSGCKWKSSAFALLAALVAAGPATAQLNAAWQTCARSDTAPDDGIAACSTIIESGTERGTNLAIAHFNRANGWLAKGEFDRAVADLSGAIGLDRSNAKAFYNRGKAWLALGAHERAVNDFTEAIRLDANFSAAYGSRGVAHYQRGDFERAIIDLDAAIRLAVAAPDASDQRVG